MKEMQPKDLATYLADMLEQLADLAHGLKDELFIDALRLSAKMARKIEAQSEEAA